MGCSSRARAGAERIALEYSCWLLVISCSLTANRQLLMAVNVLLPAVALLGPRVAAHVVTVLLPEAGPVALHEFQAAYPLRALPEVQVGYEQSQRPAVLRADGLAIAGVDKHVFVSEEVVQAQIGSEALLCTDHDVGRLRFELDELHHFGHRHAFPRAVEHRPARH